MNHLTVTEDLLKAAREEPGIPIEVLELTIATANVHALLAIAQQLALLVAKA